MLGLLDHFVREGCLPAPGNIGCHCFDYAVLSHRMSPLFNSKQSFSMPHAYLHHMQRNQNKAVGSSFRKYNFLESKSSSVVLEYFLSLPGGIIKKAEH